MAAALVTGAVLGLAGGAAGVVGAVTPRWLVPGHPGGRRHAPTPIQVGLWEACLDHTCVSVFDDHDKILAALGDWFYAVQAMTVISLLFALAAVICVLRYVCHSRNHLLRETGGLSLLSGAAYGVAVGIFYLQTGKGHLRDPLLSGLVLGESFYCGVAATVACCVSAILFCLSYHSKQDMRYEYVRIN